MQRPEIDAGSSGPWWGKDEQTEYANVPLMAKTRVSHNSRILPLRTISFHMSRLVTMVTCPLPWLASSPEMPPILG